MRSGCMHIKGKAHVMGWKCIGNGGRFEQRWTSERISFNTAAECLLYQASAY